MSLSEEVKDTTFPRLNKLSLNQEIHISDDHGVINPKSVSLLQVGDYVYFCRPDKTVYKGKVLETQEEDGLLKIYGIITNLPNAQFGFTFAKGGVFCGAIVEKEADRIYTLELSELYKGFIFLYSTKYNKIMI